MTQGKEHKCPVCGELTTKKFCSQRCYWDSLKQKSQKSTTDLAAYDNTNRCFQCGKVMPLNRYSAYCEECEMRIVLGDED
jgi:predicted nucleic acid-binding Zn ribbon protein